MNLLCIFSIIIAPTLQTYCICHADRATLALIRADDDDVWEKEERYTEKIKENSLQIVGDQKHQTLVDTPDLSCRS